MPFTMAEGTQAGVWVRAPGPGTGWTCRASSGSPQHETSPLAAPRPRGPELAQALGEHVGAQAGETGAQVGEALRAEEQLPDDQ